MKPLAGEKILIGPSSFSETDSLPLSILEGSGAEVLPNPFRRRLTKDELVQLLSKGVTGIIAGLEPLDREVMGSSGLKVISRCGSGLSNVDIEAAKGLGIKVCYTPDAPVESVAELTLGAMLCLLRSIPAMDRDMHEKKWSKKTGRLLSGKTVAIVGFGRIGRRLCELLGPFQVKVIAVDPLLKKDIDGVNMMSLEDALPQADIICLHSSGAHTLIGRAEMGLMKHGAFLLNAARGALIDEQALADAVEEGRIAGAWMDVFSEEPYSGVLTAYPQAVLTPHVGSYTAECRARMETEAVQNLIEAFMQIKGGKI